MKKVEKGVERNIDVDTHLFWGLKAGVRSFVFPYECCPLAETKGDDIHVH